ncbi:MAG: tRNA lysidine(34) synthetase TilS [Phycisphaeraceae bacterium]|nr:tRNA lysidine(34) synthetase TilS [Phycisphaeraceae bacterium]
MLKSMPTVRAITRSWRALTGGDGGGTLVACSGGADSVSLALTLWSAKAPITLGHVVHDLRSEAEALADRDLVEALAARLGVGFVERSIKVANLRNEEGTARSRRYEALAQMAGEVGVRFVASAHHADDQLESMLMAIARGAGPEGLSGVAASRPLTDSVTLIRPMLISNHADAKAICRAAGAQWAHDASNENPNRFRSAVRLGPARALAELRPDTAAGAVRAGELLRDAAMLVEERAHAILGDGNAWDRAGLRGERAIVLGAGLRSAALRMTGGIGADRLSRRVVDPVVEAIRDDSTEPRRFHWPDGVEIVVTAHRVEISKTRTD